MDEDGFMMMIQMCPAFDESMWTGKRKQAFSEATAVTGRNINRKKKASAMPAFAPKLKA